MDVTQALALNPHLARLEPAELRTLAQAFSPRSYADGATILREGDRVDASFLIVTGSVSVTRDRGPYVDEITRLGPGEFFGILSMLDEKRRAATCRAIGPLHVLSISASDYAEMTAAGTPVALALQGALADRLARDFRGVFAALHAALPKRG